jgi:hypothetical protein
MAVLKVYVPLTAMGRLSPPLSWRTSPTPESPTTVTPIEAVPDEQVIWMLLTVALAVPLPLVTVQVCAGLLGGLVTKTA